MREHLMQYKCYDVWHEPNADLPYYVSRRDRGGCTRYHTLTEAMINIGVPMNANKAIVLIELENYIRDNLGNIQSAEAGARGALQNMIRMILDWHHNGTLTLSDMG